MRVLVTGAAGFIGSHLSERLLAFDHEVIGIDCFTDYYSPTLKRCNIETALKNPLFKLLEQDILKADLEHILDGCEVVFHQAAQAGVRTSWGARFDSYTNNNVLATQRLLEAAKASSLKRFIFASSSSVYGDAQKMPLAEQDRTLPISPYGVTKMAAENLCRLYHKNFDVPTISLRYFTAYGPRQRPDMAFHKFISAMLKDKPIEIFGGGEQTRDFTFVDDIVDANILAMDKGKIGGVYNIGGGSRISLNRAIEVLESVVGEKARRAESPSQKGDMRDTWADTTLAGNELGFAPKHSIEDGLKKEFEWLVQS